MALSHLVAALSAQRARFSLKSIGLSAWIPYVAADAGALLGGWTSGYLMRRGWPALRARGAAIVFATLLAPVGMLVGQVNSPISALALISTVLFAFQFWVNNVQTLPSDLFSPGLVASISGLAGTAAGVGAMIFTFSTGWIVDHLGYAPILIASGLLVPIGTYCCSSPPGAPDTADSDLDKISALPFKDNRQRLTLHESGGSMSRVSFHATVLLTGIFLSLLGVGLYAQILVGRISGAIIDPTGSPGRRCPSNDRKHRHASQARRLD